MFTTFKRVCKFALVDFYRNKGISIAAIFILMIAIFLVTGLFFLRGASGYIVGQVQDKIDITAYFIQEATEQDILDAKDKMLTLSPDIKNITYVSKDDALAIFTQKHQDKPALSNALIQIGSNPFLPSLNITTTGSAEEYQNVADVLQSGQFSGLIDSVDYSQKKDIIDKVFSITRDVGAFGLVLAIILITVAVLVVFNTIKLAIQNSKEEISTMKIVGASSWFVRAPFIVQGAIFGLVSFLICFLVAAILAYFLSPRFLVVLGGFSLWRYFESNIWLIMLVQLCVGVGLGVVTSFIAVGKYLRV